MAVVCDGGCVCVCVCVCVHLHALPLPLPLAPSIMAACQCILRCAGVCWPSGTACQWQWQWQRHLPAQRRELSLWLVLCGRGTSGYGSPLVSQRVCE